MLCLQFGNQLQRRLGGNHAVDHRLVLDKKGRLPAPGGLKIMPASQRGRAKEDCRDQKKPSLFA